MGPQRWPQVLDMWETDSVRAWFAYTGTADMFEYMNKNMRIANINGDMKKDLIILDATYVKDSQLNIYAIDVSSAIEKSAPTASKKTLMQ
uniref:Uncharacterized protein n=1 Tax=Vitis vinifera TaxID=29760 RepID=A5AHK3_VITVI|nr:hypothetical protein VITISV_026392 [Vitis vinifera]